MIGVSDPTTPRGAKIQLRNLSRRFGGQAAVDGILNNKLKPGDVVTIRYEGPKGGPGMQEMLYSTSYLKSKGLGKACALITGGRFSGGTSGLSIGHISPEAASGGVIGLLNDGDRIEIDIPRPRPARSAERRRAGGPPGRDGSPRRRGVATGAGTPQGRLRGVARLREARHRRSARRSARGVSAGGWSQTEMRGSSHASPPTVFTPRARP